MKALVLGSSGFLGSYLGFALPRLGWDTHGASRGEAPWFPNNRGGCSAKDMEDQVRSGGYDVVINAVAMASHEACEADPESALRVNSDLPSLWAEACGSEGSQFVHVSTDAVFEGSSGVPYDEWDPTEPTGVYGRSKLAGERAVLAANSEALVLRTNFFGWSLGHKSGILDFFVSAFEDKRTITGFVDYVVSSVYVGHLVEAMVEATTRGLSGVHHAVASDALSKFDFGHRVAEEFGLDASVMAPGELENALHLSTRGKSLALSTALIERALGRPMPSCRDGLTAAHSERLAMTEYFGSG